MKKIEKNNQLAFNLVLMLLPLVPYTKILPEVINPLVFIIESVIFYKKAADIWERVDKKLLLAMTALIVFCLFNVFISSDKVLSFMDSLNMLSGFMVYLIVKGLDERNIQKSLNFIVYGGMLSSLLNLASYLINSTSGHRLEGLFNYSNTTALYFAVCLIIYLYRYEERELNLNTYVLRLGAISMITVLFLTESRGGIIIYLSSLTAMFLIKKLRKNSYFINAAILNFSGLALAYIIYNSSWIIAVFLLPLIAVLLLANPKLKSFRVKILLYSLFVSGFIFALFKVVRRLKDTGIDNAQLQERFVFYSDAIRLMAHNLLGIGAGQWNAMQFKYQTAFYDVKYVHDVFLQIGVDYGVIFLILFIAFLVYNFVKDISIKRIESIYFILAAMILLHSLLDFNMSFIYINMVFFLCIAGMSKVDKSAIMVKDKSLINRKGRIKTDEAINNAAPALEDKASGRLGQNLLFGIVITMNIAAVLLLPGELLYNTAVLYGENNNALKNFNILDIWSRFPVKTARYYNSLGTASFDLYKITGNKDYLNVSINSLKKSIDINKQDPRGYETIAKIYYNTKGYNEAAAYLEKSGALRKYYMPLEDELTECYYYMYKNKQLTSDEYLKELKNIEKNVINAAASLNGRAKYMKNQSDGKLDDLENICLGQAYEAAGDTSKYNYYIGQANKNSQIYKALMQ